MFGRDLFIDNLQSSFYINLDWRETSVSPQYFLLDRDIEVTTDVLSVVEGEGVVLVAVAVGPGQEHVALAQTAGALPLEGFYYHDVVKQLVLLPSEKEF